jgi:L-aminopeptidase/D-esterase-like protein
MKGLTDIPGILVGHASDFDALTGCTVILAEQGAVAGVDVRGSASGTEELNLLDPMHVTERIHAVVFSGGSAFGLETASGVRRWLEHKGVGFKTPYARVPLVFGAILYDLGLGKSTVRPTREMGEIAAGAATANAVAEGAVGAGTGASVGKALGMTNATKSGLGTATVALDGRYTGALVSALAVVNAVGDVREPATGKIIAGTRLASNSMKFADTSLLVRGGAPAGFRGGNTTLVAVATNAALDKVEARKLAQFGSLGMARSITPVNLMSDGDLVVALSLGTVKASIDALGVAAAESVSQAIVRAVMKAEALGGLPSASEIAAASSK